jgi:serine protease Do
MPRGGTMEVIPMNKFKSFGIFAVAIIIVAALLFTGCSYDTSSKVTSATVNEKGELVINYADGKTEIIGEKNDNSNTSEITNDIALATSKGLRSSVSIICEFVDNTSAYYSAGSGVILKLDKEKGNAFIVTNYHVVHGSNFEGGISNKITVYLYGSEYADMGVEATYVGGSLYYDIAVLYVENSDLIKNSCVLEADVADSDNVSVGQTAIAIGNAEGYGISASSGIISVDSEYIDMVASDDKTVVSFRVMRIDTAVNHGNSGGGLFNARGELIGIVNAKIIDEDVENIGYAIPSTLAIAVANNIIDNCFEKDCKTAMRCLLGITVGTTSTSMVYNEETGLVSIVETIGVVEVSETGIAHGLIKADDILISATLNGVTKKITRQFHVIDLLLNARPGDVLELTVKRGNETVTVSVNITEGCVTPY